MKFNKLKAYVQCFMHITLLFFIRASENNIFNNLKGWENGYVSNCYIPQVELGFGKAIQNASDRCYG